MTVGVGFNVAAVDEAMTPLELFETHDDRDQKHLLQELQISRIAAMKVANGFLSDVFPSIS